MLGVLALCLLTSGLGNPHASPTEEPQPVVIVKDVAYVEGDGADPVYHKLDLYLPKERKDFPVLFFVHGGGWKSGDKSDFAFLGKALAAQGIGVVSTNYRLYPAVKFPENLRDVARAFAWVHAHISEHGGRVARVLVGGHSAGGHLVSLLALDETYLQAVKLSPRAIHGVVSISGLYSIPKGRFPLFEDSDEGAKKASPTRMVKGGHPPFLLLYADQDFPRFDDMAEEFARTLRDAGCEVTCLKIKDRTHGSVATRIEEDDDPARKAILQFVGKP